MFRASSAHLQEDTVVYMQHMVLSLSMRVPGGLSVHSCYLFMKYYSPLHVSSLKCSSSGGYSCIHAAYGPVTLYESSWWPVGTQLLFIHEILFSSTCFEPQVLIFRRIQLYTCSIWSCHSLWEFLVACRYTAVYRQATRNSHREWQYHMPHVYNCIILKMSTWGSKHVDENSILLINNSQCIKLVINI